MRLRPLLWLALLVAAPSAAQSPKPLFAADDTIRLTIRGPLSSIVRSRSDSPVAGTLAVNGEALPVTLSVRGITRRKSEVCDFPPLRVDFTRPPPASSPFAGQKKLKLVTHCRSTASFQQYLLLEYAAYRMFNVITPQSMRVRLASIDYQGDDGRPLVSRLGFFLEDVRDVAARNGMREIHAGELIPISTLSPAAAARYALFQHMIANHDWSMRAGPPGDECCHNAKLIGASGVAPGAVIPVPYDFDFSGLVSPPYAGPPAELAIDSVRDRLYRGYCVHNAQVAAAAAQLRALRPQLLAALTATPQLEQRTAQRAANFLDEFFRQIATDDSTNSKILKRCVS
jgi:hypothetical protein